MKKKDYLVNEIFIGAPCNVDWDEMEGDKQVRNCLGCNKSVYNLSEFTLDEAEKLIQTQGDKICLLMERDHDGKPITQTNQKEFNFPAILKGIAASVFEFISFNHICICQRRQL